MSFSNNLRCVHTTLYIQFSVKFRNDFASAAIIRYIIVNSVKLFTLYIVTDLCGLPNCFIWVLLYYPIIKPTVTKITDILSLIVVENDIEYIEANYIGR